MVNLDRIFAVAAVASVALNGFAKADEQLMQGVKSFVCDGTPIVLLRSDADWVFTDQPELEVHKTRDGWRFGDQGLGFIMFLRESEDGTWIAEHLSEDGFEKLDCIDVTESTAKVVTAIKPKLDENIIDIQEQLVVANQELATMQEDYKRLEAEYREDYEDLQAEYDASTRQHSSELSKLRSRHANEIQSREATIMKLQQEYDQLETLYSRLLGGEQADVISAKLYEFVAMSPSERNALIAQTSLGKKGVERPDLVDACAKTLRDKAKIDDTCRETLIEFLMLEGF